MPDYSETQNFSGGVYGQTATRDAQPFKGIVIHVTGKPNLQSELDYMSKPDPNRPGQYGYHYLIDRDGKIYQTAPFSARTNHILPSQGFSNNNSLGVAFVGGDKGMTPDQIAAGKQLTGELQKQFNIPSNMIVSHGMLDPKTRGAGNNLGVDNTAEGAQFITALQGGGGTRVADSGGGGGGGFNLSQNIYDYLKDKGVPGDVAKGAIISMMGESGRSLDPTSYNDKDPGGSVGFAQWNGPRRAALETMAKGQGLDPHSAEAQFNYWKAELEGAPGAINQPDVLDALKAGKSVYDGTSIWTRKFERPTVDNSAQRFIGNYKAVNVDDSGKLMIAAGAPSGATSESTAAPAPTFGQALQKGDVGGALAALTAKTGKEGDQPSALENIAKTFGGDQQQQQSGMRESAPMLPQAQDTSAALYGPASQLWQQTVASMARPLTWSSAPPGAGAGQQYQVPGMTLNSVGPGYG